MDSNHLSWNDVCISRVIPVTPCWYQSFDQYHLVMIKQVRMVNAPVITCCNYLQNNEL